MHVDPPEQGEQLRAFVRAQRSQDVLVDAVEHVGELRQTAAASGGDGDDVAALVGGIGRAGDPPAGFRAIAVADGPISHDELIAEVNASLKLDESAVRDVIEEMADAELVEAQPSRVTLTDAGRELFDRTTAETAPISAKLYAGIPAEDLAVAGRVLTLITQRANVELAGS
jgi:DNA-binding MarR family transcriptional regulator